MKQPEPILHSYSTSVPKLQNIIDLRFFEIVLVFVDFVFWNHRNVSSKLLAFINGHTMHTFARDFITFASAERKLGCG